MYDVLRYIHEHIGERLDLPMLAEKFGYSKWHFGVKFREFTGRTVMDYIRHYRMQLASLDVLAGMKVIDVAMNYGYESVSGFNKSFLTEFGCLPREYKNKAKESMLYYERRKANMYQLSDRCEMLREEAVNAKSSMRKYCLQRTVYFTVGMEEARSKGLPEVRCMSYAMANVIDKFRPYIAPGEFIAGHNYGDAGMGEWYRPCDPADPIFADNGIPEETVRKFVASGWRDVTAQSGDLTKEGAEAQQEWAAIGRCIDSNHSVLGYEAVLKYGFKGILDKIEKYEKINGKNDFYDSLREICHAACTMGEKYAAEAQRLLDSGNSEYNQEDLRKIIASCGNVPRNPASSFLEAVQALWFAHILNTWEDTINANSVGRLDQILYPFYKADVEKGIMTKEEAFEIVCCLWIKLYRDYDVQQSCVGGTDADGKDCVNELSYMMLDATERLDFVRCLSVRFSKNTDRNFLKRALEVVGHLQKGVPFFFNDGVMVPALINAGIAKEDAYGYTQIGCVETVIPGKSNPHAVSGETNLLKALEYVLCNGNSMMYPELAPGLRTGELSKFVTFDRLYEAVIEQIGNIIDLTCASVASARKKSVIYAPRPYKALLTEGCIESGRDFNDAGAKYDYYQIMLGGIPNLADSLAVLRKFVYKEKKYTLEEVKNILENDFPDETVRLEFVNKAPKYGNDIDEVDDIAVDITNKACDFLEKMNVKYGLSFHAQPFTFLWMVDHGRTSAASPDGRRKGEIIAYSVSPMQGRDFSGLTSLFNSISKFPTERTPGTTSAIVEVDPKLFTDANIGILTQVLVSAAEKGLSNVQFNTVDADTMIDAREHPERHRNLAVRVSGFSQKFNLLSPELQDHIINRTKHACM